MRKKKRKVNYKARRLWMLWISVAILVFFYFLSISSISNLFSERNASFLIRSVSTIIILIGFYAIDHYFDLRFRVRHYIFVALIAVTGIMLSPLYFVYPQYDKFLHFIQPLFLGSIIFYATSFAKINFKVRLLLTFSILLTIIGIFEIGEYILDNLFNWRLQGVFDYSSGNFELIMSRIDDTMIDMIIGIIASLAYLLSVGILSRKKNI
jgi:hypothetical protein